MSEFSSNLAENCRNYLPVHTDRHTHAQTGLIPWVKIFSPEMTEYKKKTTCMLYLQADHLFHEQMGYSEEASIELMTRHVQRVNSIYRPIGN